MRKSTTTRLEDSAGEYEQEVFDCESPKNVIIGVHGSGVRRWDGEEFYYQVAEHFTNSIVILTDQNQVVGDGCKINGLDILVERNQKAIDLAKSQYPNAPIWVVGHSMGCGVSSLLDTTGLSGMILVTPSIGDVIKKNRARYGDFTLDEDIEVTSSDGFKKILSKEFLSSTNGVVWQDTYRDLIDVFSPVHVFESGDDEVLNEERFELRDMRFTSYEIIDGAKHNFSGKYSHELFSKLEKIMATV